MVLNVHTDEKTGSDLTGSSGDTDRVLTLDNTSNVVSGGFDVRVNNNAFMRTADYTVDTTAGEVTFKNAIRDSDDIEVTYYTDITAQAGALAAKGDVTRKLKGIDASWSDSDIDKELNEAARKRTGITGKFYNDRHLVDSDEIDEDKKLFELHWEPIISVNKVFHNRSEVDSSNYTTDLTNGTIDFTASWRDDNLATGDELLFQYTPEVFADLEIWMAIENILKLTALQDTGDQLQSNQEIASDYVEQLIKEINSRNVIPESGVADHARRPV